MKRQRHETALFLASLLLVVALSPGPLWTAENEEDLAATEERIVREIEQLIDATGEISAGSEEKAIELIRKGVKANEAGNFDKALELYDRALAEVPTSATAYFEKGYTYHAKGEQRRAFDAVARAVLLDPKLEMAHIVKASLLDDMGYSDRAVAAYQTLLEINPASYLGQLNLGITLMRRRQLDESRAALEQARQLQPDHPAVYLHLANLANVQGQEYEELEHLQAFVERGADDPRLPAVQERIEELQYHEITLESGSQFGAIELTEQLARILWRTEKHQQTFPTAKGYFPSYEEEHDVITTVLSMWRGHKEENPQDEHGQYDLLLAVDEAGFLDEYIWYVNQQRFGEAAAAWLEEHQERVDAFLTWADAEGFLSTDEPAAEGQEEEEVNLPRMILAQAEQSSLTYDIGSIGAGATASFLERESRRYRRQLDLDGDDRVTRKQTRAILARPQALTGIEPLIEVLRVHLPGEDEWRQAVGLCQYLGLRYRDLAPPRPLPLSLERSGDTVTVAIDPGAPAWMLYALAKATFRHEPGLRRQFGAPEGDRATVTEEVVAWATLAQAYRDTPGDDESGDGAEEPPQPDPYLDQVLEIATEGELEGFVLFEVVHKTYGVPLERLTRDQVKALDSYLRLVLQPVTRPEG